MSKLLLQLLKCCLFDRNAYLLVMGGFVCVCCVCVCVCVCVFVFVFWRELFGQILLGLSLPCATVAQQCTMNPHLIHYIVAKSATQIVDLAMQP